LQAGQINRRNLKKLWQVEEAMGLACPGGKWQKPEELLLSDVLQLREDS
jgi:hypothetical protein